MCETYHAPLLERGQLVLLYIDGPQGRKYIIIHNDWRRTTAGLTEALFGKGAGWNLPSSLLFLRIPE